MPGGHRDNDGQTAGGCAPTIRPHHGCAPGRPFEQQLVAHRDYLLKFARLQLRNESWAEDAVSETLLAALNKPQAFANRSQLKTWLVGILKHKVIDQLRRHAREATALTDDDALAIAAYLKSLPPVANDVPGPFGPGEPTGGFVMRVVAP